MRWRLLEGEEQRKGIRSHVVCMDAWMHIIVQYQIALGPTNCSSSTRHSSIHIPALLPPLGLLSLPLPAMPLVVLVGHPASGKTRAAQLLALALQKQLQTEGKQVLIVGLPAEPVSKDESDSSTPSSAAPSSAPSSPSSSDSSSSSPAAATSPSSSRPTEIHIINSETLGLSRSAMFANTIAEKRFMGLFRSAVERLVTGNRIVILDALNNIKGFRYELFTRSKSQHTTHCVVYVSPSMQFEQVKEWNEEKKKKGEDCYEPAVLQDLYQRMEEPNESKRWDNPLFLADEKTWELPLDNIVSFVLKGKKLTPGVSTMPFRLEDSSYLYEIDQTTTQIIQAILKQQASGIFSIGDEMPLQSNLTNEKLFLSKILYLADLRRIQQQFLSLAKLRPLQGKEQIASSFVRYLNEALKPSFS